jgi:hypothetical protein
VNVKITIDHAESTRYASFNPLVVEYDDSARADRVQLSIEGSSITVSLPELLRALIFISSAPPESAP